jgi:hypothetical protein
VRDISIFWALPVAHAPGREEKKIIKLFEIILIGDAMFVRKSNEP